MPFESRNTVKPPPIMYFIIAPDARSFNYNGLVIAYPLERNPFDLLRTLARMIGTDVARSKSAIILGLEQRITNVPLDLAKFPVFQQPEDTIDECQQKLIQLYRFRSTDRDEAIHFGFIQQRIHARLEVLRQKLKADSEEKQQKPSWVGLTTDEPPSERPYWRLCLQTGDQVHDGYCSENDCSEFHSNVNDFEIPEWEEVKTVYLSGEWRGLAAKTHWKSGHSYACGSGSGVCMASRITRLISFERVDV